MPENSLFYTVDVDVILIYGIKWFASKASCILLATTFKKIKLANKFFLSPILFFFFS